MMNRTATIGLTLALMSAPLVLSAVPDEDEPWRSETTSDGTSITKRHETGSVVVDGNLYVIGGRAEPPVEVYKPGTDGWENLGAAPEDIHHFQPVVLGKEIYIVGAMTCCFPNEPTVANVHVFNTQNKNWTTDGQIPAARRRGGAGAVVYKDKIYLIGGNTMGHDGGAVAWFDEFDPATGNWTTLPDAPIARDHFQAVVIGNQLVVAGGRQTDIPNPFDKTVAETNIYNFDTGEWRQGAPIPTQRAGAIAVGIGTEVVVAGGEAMGQNTARDVVEAYDLATDSWRTLKPMQEGRHSGAGSVIGNRLHMVAGSGGVGGAPELTSHESLSLVGGSLSNTDQDNDGLSNEDELTVYFTDVDNADTDADGINDGDEVAQGSDPKDPESPGSGDGSTDGAVDGGTDGETDSSGDGSADGMTDGAPVEPPTSSGGGGSMSWPPIMMLFGLLLVRRRLLRT